MALILSLEELATFSAIAQKELGAIAPTDRYAATQDLAKRVFEHDDRAHQIADRYFAMMLCLDVSREELDQTDRGVYGKHERSITGHTIQKLWDFFGDTSRHISPNDRIRASEII